MRAVEETVQVHETSLRIATILDILASATLEGVGRDVFLKKENWRTQNDFVVDAGVLEKFARTNWGVGNLARVDLRLDRFSPLLISPWIEEGEEKWMPIHDCYSQFLAETFINAGKSRACEDETLRVPLEIWTELIPLESDDAHRWALVSENPRRDRTLKTPCPPDGRWHEWPITRSSFTGGLYFLTMFGKRTELGDVRVRIRDDGERQFVAIALAFRGARPLLEK